jgi:phosphocarrier protein
VLGAQVKCGDEVEFTCEGADEVAALAGMVAAIEGGLGE